jgi:hypothetical protein
MRLVRREDLIHSGGVTYDAYLLRDHANEILYSKTRVSAEGTEFYVRNHVSFQTYWKQVAHYYFRILRDADSSKGFFLQLQVERPFNSAPEVVELDERG